MKWRKRRWISALLTGFANKILTLHLNHRDKQHTTL